MGPMTGNLPQFRIEDVWRDDLLESTFTVLFLYQVYQSVVYVSTAGLEKAGPG
jgi:hypothetical protein